MKIITIRITRATKHRWYFHLIEKEVEVIETTQSTVLRGNFPIYQLFTNKMPLRYIPIEDAQIVREREATSQEIYSGKCNSQFPKGRNGVGK